MNLLMLNGVFMSRMSDMSRAIKYLYFRRKTEPLAASEEKDKPVHPRCLNMFVLDKMFNNVIVELFRAFDLVELVIV